MATILSQHADICGFSTPHDSYPPSHAVTSKVELSWWILEQSLETQWRQTIYQQQQMRPAERRTNASSSIVQIQ